MPVPFSEVTVVFPNSKRRSSGIPCPLSYTSTCNLCCFCFDHYPNLIVLLPAAKCMLDGIFPLTPESHTAVLFLKQPLLLRQMLLDNDSETVLVLMTNRLFTCSSSCETGIVVCTAPASCLESICLIGAIVSALFHCLSALMRK